MKNVCIETSKLSTCVSKNVGAVLFKDGRITCVGYNGVPSGVKHCEDIFTNYIEKQDRTTHHEWSNKNENHAEQNLIAFCANNGIQTNDSSLILTISPCIHCAKLLLNTGIEKVIFLKEYDKETDGVGFLNKNGVECIHYNEW